MSEIAFGLIFLTFIIIVFKPLVEKKRAEMSLQEVLNRIQDLDGKAARNKEDKP